jgi:2-phosphoglycerate kinase
VNEPRRINPLPLGADEHGLPYSRGLMARSLMAAGVAGYRAYALASRVHDDLQERGEGSVELERLEALAVEVLGEQEGRESIQRLRRFQELRELDLPIMVFIGGATGTGKSTVATEAAYRLGITRLTSTDFIRQTMRAFFTPEMMPSVHMSSFEANGDGPDAILEGFLDQTRNVLVGVEGAIERALTEGWSMTLEGVHLVPGLVPARIDGALVVHAVLAIEDEDVHRTQFHVRDASTGGMRAMDRYLSRIAAIRRLQGYIVERAHAAGVPVIEGSNPERATAALLELVLASAEQAGSG